MDLAQAILLTDDPELLPLIPADRRLPFEETALDHSPVDPEEVFARLRPKLADCAGGLVVDMGWAVANLQGATSLESWGAVADRLARTLGRPVVSIYNQDLTIEEQMQAAFRAHRQFLAPSGLHDNPYWIPADLLDGALLDDQLSFMLGRVVPDYADLRARRRTGQMHARGATPSWLAQAARLAGGAAGAGALAHPLSGAVARVHRQPRRSTGAFRAARRKRPGRCSPICCKAAKRAPMPTGSANCCGPKMGQKTPSAPACTTPLPCCARPWAMPGAVVRMGEYYRLNAPRGSWIDIDTFEQLCRRGLSLFKRGEDEAALRIYAAAEQLYTGDLFEDLPLEYVQPEQEDWCMPRRIWLREMALKLQYDFAKVLVTVASHARGAGTLHEGACHRPRLGRGQCRGDEDLCRTGPRGCDAPAVPAVSASSCHNRRNRRR